MDYHVRNAKMEDLPRIEEIYAFARDFMARNGNPNQWGKSEPAHEQLVQDIMEERLFVIAAQDDFHGVFFFDIGQDPTYAYIENGAWRSNATYGTIHRIAGDGSGGILGAAVSFAKNNIDHIRIDTHRDNHIMQQALAKHGFQKRGIIYVEDGSARIAYDLISE